jgi:hypothetical protein
MSEENKELVTEINEMNDFINNDIVQVEEVKEVKGEEPKVESLEPEPEPEKVVTKEEPTPEPVVEDPRDKEIADLRSKLAEKESKPKEVIKKEEPKEETFTEQDFIGTVDPDDLYRDPKVMNGVLNKIYQQAVKDARNLGSEQVLKSLPEIVKENIRVLDNLKTLRDSFYGENPDLKPFQKVVATVFEEVASANVDKDFEEVMKLVGPEVRSRLGLQKELTAKLKEVKKEENRSPRLPSKGSRSGGFSSKPSTDSLQAELEEMTKTLRG